ncbi:uncharacterized protein LOC127871089 isoform X2 [Dreissena polymorpha]|uniref:Macro domain-containing protein n=1 Tax=Dreissena polymorpha TaxID=45954 RepID=A0A9D4LF15_DREPO|nr:uncharacterized protein LOC127871089 isoform X2 [Dreissena polymorpha]KAH3855776.1 hypothetical protein DPMN_098345 [Dreissena polymorpha]
MAEDSVPGRRINTLPGEWTQHEMREKDVDEIDVGYFEFLMKEICPWNYCDRRKTIQAYCSENSDLKNINEVFDTFRKRCRSEICVDCDIAAVKSWLDRTDIKERYPNVFPVIESDRSVHKITLFSSDEDALKKIVEHLERFMTSQRRHGQYLQHSEDYSEDYDTISQTPGEKLGTFYLTAKHVMCICVGDIIDYDGPDVGIVNPAVVRKSGQIDGKGILFERIKKAGGDTYEDSLSKNTPVDTISTFCIVTKGGRLKAKIIHPLRQINGKSTRQTNIFFNISDCLSAARRNKLKRLVFPFVYSGSGGVDIKDCAYHYACALTEFFREYPTQLIGPYETFFVEIDKPKAVSIMQHLRCLLATQSSELMNVPRSIAPRSDQVLAEYVFKNTTIVVEYGAAIGKVNVDVIVCPEYTQTDYRGFISNAIKFAFRIEIGKIDEKVRKGKVASSVCSLHPKCERNIYVYHIEAVTFKAGSYATKEESKNAIRMCIQEVFEKLKRHKSRNIKSIAIPLIGVTDVNDISAVKTVCKVFLKAVLACSSTRTDGPHLYVHLINQCQQITDWLQENLYREIYHP